MFEIIYISPSCRQAVEFIDKLKWSLMDCDIYKFYIDRENIQLKTDKFIVSAVDIFGGNLGLSHHMTKYYIDKVSDFDFQNKRARKVALERLKCLKSTFWEGTREISEEELIDILMEVSIYG